MNETPIQITGNLTADVELRYTPSGRAVANLRVAANPRRYDRQSGEWVDGQANYFDVEVWAGPENVAESLCRGDRVVIFGNLRTQTWTPEGADKARSKFVVVAAEIGTSLRYATAKPVRSARADDAPDTEEEPF
jgi:single-strand DNA-binding protein